MNEVFTLANQLTLLRMLLIPAFVILTLYGEFGWALATFMIAGERCTRACGFCAVQTAKPLALEADEPQRVAEATRRMGDAAPHARVLALSMHKDSVYVREILRAGARGYLLKDSIDVDLLAAVRAVAKGEAFLSPAVSDSVLDDYRKHVTDPLDLLSSREREVLQLIAEGKTNKEIATLLNLSVYTVDAHRGRIMEKLNLHSTGELVRFAVRKGLVD